MSDFKINKHGRIIFEANFNPIINFSDLKSFEQFETLIERDFNEKASTEKVLSENLKGNLHKNPAELLREVIRHIYWSNRYFLTIYQASWCRWSERRETRKSYLPFFTPNPILDLSSQIKSKLHEINPAQKIDGQDQVVQILSQLMEDKAFSGSTISSRPIEITEHHRHGDQLVMIATNAPSNFPIFDDNEIFDVHLENCEMEALLRQTIFLKQTLLWHSYSPQLVKISQLKKDDLVLMLSPSSDSARRFLEHSAEPKPNLNKIISIVNKSPQYPITPFEPVDVRKTFRVLPKFESLAVHLGEINVTNDDIIRNEGYCWSEMTAKDIFEKTGINERRYTELSLEEMSIRVAKEALAVSGRKPEEIGGVIFCSATSTMLMPSNACLIASNLGIFQVQSAFDVVSACGGFPYGVAQAIRILQEVKRPVLVVCAEKFSDKIGPVRTSRMIFGDGASAFIIGPAKAGEDTDIEFYQTYASGPLNEVISIKLPNVDFGNNVSVYGPDVRTMVRRYLIQMTGELRSTMDYNNPSKSVLDSIERVVPHHANKPMILKLLEGSGLKPELFYFNIDRMGNTSSASIPIALFDAVKDKEIVKRTKVFAPGFGAGAVGGYVVMNFDPKVVSKVDGFHFKKTG